jgi:hypothetical protein
METFALVRLTRRSGGRKDKQRGLPGLAGSPHVYDFSFLLRYLFILRFSTGGCAFFSSLDPLLPFTAFFAI